MYIIMEIPDGATKLKVNVDGKDPISDQLYKAAITYDEDDIFGMADDFDLYVDDTLDEDEDFIPHDERRALSEMLTNTALKYSDHIRELGKKLGEEYERSK